MAIPALMMMGVLCVTALCFQFVGSTLPDIGLVSPQGISALVASWAKGDVTVLVRHAERCDRSAAPCLAAPDGITGRGRDQAAAIGEAFSRLGTRHADVFASPMTRTKQTAAYMFGAAAAEQGWLADCRAITPGDIARSKVAGRNLILVTHSHCINKIEKDIKFPAAGEPAYGSLLFIILDEGNKMPVAAGAINAEQFIADVSADR